MQAGCIKPWIINMSLSELSTNIDIPRNGLERSRGFTIDAAQVYDLKLINTVLS